MFGGWDPFLLRLDLADEHCTDDEHAAYGGDGAHVLAEEDDGADFLARWSEIEAEFRKPIL